jgi:hypothetical protein
MYNFSSVPQTTSFRPISLRKTPAAHAIYKRNLHDNGFPIHAEPSNNINLRVRGQAIGGFSAGELHFKTSPEVY